MDSGFVEQIDYLEERVMALEQRNRELNIKLMRTLAQLSDAEDTLKRWRAELEIVASKGNHNLCHIWIPGLLRNTIGHTGGFPDLEGTTREEFDQGCKAFQDDIFGLSQASQKQVK